jgi:hypothetical protein
LLTYFIVVSCIQYEYIKNNLIRKSEAQKNKVTKCNENQSKEETKNKAPKIINTGKYLINQPVNITYQEGNYRINFLLHTHFIKYSFTFKIVPFKQLLTYFIVVS